VCVPATFPSSSSSSSSSPPPLPIRPLGRHISPALARAFPNIRKKLKNLADSETSESSALFHYQHDVVVIIADP
jgi:hypothetical protein